MASTPTSFPLPQHPRPRWDDIDVVLLDMDGTLLDLRFDNYFWLELVPQRFAQRHSMTLDAARIVLMPRFAATQGTLDWYCIDHWTRELELDIAGLKREVRERIVFLPGAQAFLTELRQRGLRTVLLTNAHRDSLAIKAEQTDLPRYFDALISSHAYGAPKESAEFWPKAQADLNFDPARSLFVDDTLAVLRAARQYGIAQIFAISKPDSAQDQRAVDEFAAVPAVIDLLRAP